ncbi:hypothetical protein [Parasphingorhabdus pacifica]
MTARTPSELRVLRDLFQVCDPTPDHLLGAAYAAHARGWSGAVPLALVGDSTDTSVATRARATTESRVLTFTMPGRILEVDLVPTVPGVFRAAGMVISRAGQGAPSGEVVLRTPGGQQSERLDRHGAFTVDDVPSGPLSMVFQPTGAQPAVADWFVC